MKLNKAGEKVSVVHVVASLYPRHGGPSRTVVQLTDSIAKNIDISVSLLSQGALGEPSVPSSTGAIDRRKIESSSRIALSFGLPIRHELTNITKHPYPIIIHNHGVWLPVNHWASSIARRNGIPLVIHPRGMLEPWAISEKFLKKRLAMTLFQRKDIDSAKVLVATALSECENIRRLGFRQPIAVIPNGVKLALLGDVIPQPSFLNENFKTALFLSRVHPKKGLLNLIRAWSNLSPENWRLCIAGPNEGGHLDEVMSLARQLGIQDFIEYVGEVDGDQKDALYRSCDLFVLPTFSENFGVVVAEALSHGLPVITTHGAPWSDLEVYGCGWWVEIGIDPLQEALRKAMALSDEERHAMGARGKEYVRRYNWEDIAKQTIEVYRWILGKGDQPQCVLTD